MISVEYFCIFRIIGGRPVHVCVCGCATLRDVVGINNRMCVEGVGYIRRSRMEKVGILGWIHRLGGVSKCRISVLTHL